MTIAPPTSETADLSSFGRAIPWLIVLFVLTWVVYPSLVMINLDSKSDMVENYIWGIGWQWGYEKHPPLFAWIAAAWLQLFPRTDLAYRVLAALNMGVGLWAMWRISRRYLDVSQQLVLILTAFALPTTFLALRYNANSAMMPVWALTFLFYLRTLEHRRLLDAALLGLFAALSMLTKYASVALLLAILIHALWDREVRTLLLSPLMAVAAVVFLVVSTPHLIWLIDTDFLPLTYATHQGGSGFLDNLLSQPVFLIATVLYAIPILFVGLVHRRPGDPEPLFATEEWSALWRSVEGRALIFVTILPIAITMLLALLANAKLSSVWGLPFFVFIPILVIAFFPKSITRRAFKTVPVVLAIFICTMLVVGQLNTWLRLETGLGDPERPVRAVTAAVEDNWRKVTAQPLRFVGGPRAYAYAVAFYASDSPYAFVDGPLEVTPWIDRKDVERAGGVYICTRRKGADCAGEAMEYLGRVDRMEHISVPAVSEGYGPQTYEFEMAIRLPEGS